MAAEQSQAITAPADSQGNRRRNLAFNSADGNSGLSTTIKAGIGFFVVGLIGVLAVFLVISQRRPEPFDIRKSGSWEKGR